MNVKKYIHPRNKYKKSPDYKQLAITYPEFREIAIMDLAGKVRIDFQDKKSLRVLTQTLLKHDFDLHVNIPLDNLNPAITLRLNYILWIEDLMKYSNLKMDEVTGIDIGTGAICIYALLLAKIYRCHVIATEVDEKSIEYAEECVKRNNLCDLIKVILVDSDRIFKGVVEDNNFYDFSMCNPPFYGESEDDNEKVEKALPPRNAPTGKKGELKVKGGEVAFVTKMIEESIEMKDRIKIYSTMIGRKADLFQLKSLMRSNNIENLTWTEFCQGHTTRWGLAWSFLPKNILDLSIAPVIRKSGKSKVQCLRKDYKTAITFPVEEKDPFSCLDDLISFLITTMKELNIQLENVPPIREDSWVCEITATERSWEHSRRKRRLMQRQLVLKKLKSAENSVFEPTSVDDVEKSTEESDDDVERLDLSSTSLIKHENNVESGSKENSDKESGEPSDAPLLICTLCVERGDIESSEKEVAAQDAFRIQMIFGSGSGGIDALQSLRQYLINKLKVKNKMLDNRRYPKKKRKRTKKTCTSS